MIKRVNMIQEIKREELPWTRLKRGPDEVDEVIAETKRDAGEWTRLKKENGGNNSDDGARTKKGLREGGHLLHRLGGCRLD